MSVFEPDPVPLAEVEGAEREEPIADLAASDTLLKVSWRNILKVRALRGVILLALAMTILVWPGRTGRALGVMIGFVLALYAGTVALELVRNKIVRSFFPILSVGVSGGLAAALLVEPDDSLATVAQIFAVFMLAAAGATVVLIIARRHALAWGLAKASVLGVAGGLLLVFPETLAAAATSIAAGGLAAVALIDVFTVPESDEPEEPIERRGPDTSDEPEELTESARQVVGAAGLSQMAGSVRTWIRRRPSVAEDRAGLMEKIYFEGPTSAVRFARFVTLMILASAIAALGVVAESTAVVIGAMLVAPLMVPLMGTAYAVTMGWMRRLGRSAGISVLGVALAIGVGVVVGAVAGAVDVENNTQVLARIAPTTVDLGIAVAAGAAGAFALTRRDVSDSLPGVAVAISLVPPLTVVGICWQQGEWSSGNGALLLFLTNAVAILVVGGMTFVIVGAAPLKLVSHAQERWATALAGVVALAGIVFLLLLLNGTEIASTEASRGQITKAVSEWVDEHQTFEQERIRTLQDGSVQIDLAGPGTPPDLDALLAELQDIVGENTEVTVTWTEQNRTSVGG